VEDFSELPEKSVPFGQTGRAGFESEAHLQEA
jgi:hypothetical protein